MINQLPSTPKLENANFNTENYSRFLRLHPHNKVCNYSTQNNLEGGNQQQNHP